MTYLQTVNNILKRLRERTVSTVNETTYSTLVSVLVNDAQSSVEDAWSWSGLRTTLTATTSDGIFSYELNGTQSNITVLDVINDTSNYFLQYSTAHSFNNWFLNGNPGTGAPQHYSFNGISADGDTQIDLYPIPDGVYSIHFNVIQRSADLELDSDIISVPSKPIELLAYALAVEERGEEGGASAVSAYSRANHSLQDAISLDALKHPEETMWYEA